ncbi:MAG: tRNA uridine-5-carboxymethylaminomethyl(34) synthesis GTPase MnmE [Armatimonadetes bacterium]|nr:tRNA uridine-5-carboxymethylaminomethyl(34) synthesis GTPase MnmE [Armatimonadota bacterium]
MRSLTDTIVAPITGPGPAPVATIRLSGPDAWKVGSQVFQPWPEHPEPMRALYGSVGEGDALALPFAEGRSYTGEPCVEISVHGSRASVVSLVESCMRCGSRMADPGEFTYRAFMNGRMDLSMAEGVADMVLASTGRQLRQAELHRSGALRDRARAIRGVLLDALAAVEAQVDFSEEVGPLDRASLAAKIGEAITEIQSLLQTAQTGRLLREGVRIAIVGLPNAGKSSLLNAILGTARAIVTDVPGTTRDTIEEQVEFGGLLWVLTDTAGLRETGDRVESEGVARARRALDEADLVWYVYDASLGWTSQDERLITEASRPALKVANKTDLAPGSEGDLQVSALAKSGIELLFESTVSRLEIGAADDRVLIRERHAPLLQGAVEGAELAVQSLGSNVPLDLSAVGLQQAIQALGQVTGESGSEDLLDSIFSRFCIGK